MHIHLTPSSILPFFSLGIFLLPSVCLIAFCLCVAFFFFAFSLLLFLHLLGRACMFWLSKKWRWQGCGIQEDRGGVCQGPGQVVQGLLHNHQPANSISQCVFCNECSRGAICHLASRLCVAGFLICISETERARMQESRRRQALVSILVVKWPALHCEHVMGLAMPCLAIPESWSWKHTATWLHVQKGRRHKFVHEPALAWETPTFQLTHKVGSDLG